MSTPPPRPEWLYEPTPTPEPSRNWLRRRIEQRIDQPSTPWYARRVLPIAVAGVVVLGVAAHGHGSHEQAPCIVNGVGNELCGDAAASYCRLQFDSSVPMDAASIAACESVLPK